MTAKRVNVFRNGSKNEGRCLLVGDSFSELITAIDTKLNITTEKLYTSKGAVIDSVEAIQDDEVVFVSSGEAFLHPQQDSTDVAPANNGVGNHMPSTPVNPPEDTDWISLNVGGKYFLTTRSTLVSGAPGSMLERMFSRDSTSPWSSSVDSTGAYLIDRSAQYFEPILNYLRHGELVLDRNISAAGVLEEATFFGLDELAAELESRVREEQPANDKSAITRREFVLRLFCTPTTDELRCQGINFSQIDLSKLDLRNINFRYAILHKANLSGANLSECNFERADMSHCILDGAKLIGVRMLCVNLEGSSMKNCYFEDPAGKQAYLEGANLKFVNLDGSCMVGVNLRVATLRKANLQNCDLRGAILAGADMEDADLTGSDLQEANLRGANLNGAYLELIVNPLHMSQTIPNR